MSVDGFAAILFVLFLAVFLWKKRDKVILQRALFPLLYVVMYRSKLGIKSMNSLAKRWPRFLRVLGDVGIVVGFIGMVFICYELVRGTIKLFTTPDAAPGIQPVLPIEAQGVFFVPFLYWIISIFLLAVVHEFAHGVIARVHKMPVKSSGFAFLCLIVPVIPAAFVEPDEKVLRRRSFRQQWAVFAAGPVSNILFALLVLVIALPFAPVMTAAFAPTGVEVVSLGEGGAAETAGLAQGDIITFLNDVPITSTQNVSEVIDAASPGDNVTIKTKTNEYMATLNAKEGNESAAVLGINGKAFVEPKEEFVAAYGAWLPSVIKWVAGLLFWLFLLNVGIGLFNLVPIGPLDGGRMLQLVCLKFFKKQTALKVWSWTSFAFITLILGNLLIGLF